MGLSMVPVPDAPAQTAVQQAAAAALESIEKTGSAAPRGPDGRFVSASAAPEASPTAGQPATTDEPDAPPPDGQPAAPKAPASPVPDEPAPASEEPAPAEEAKPLTVELLDRNGQPMELELGDEQTADLVRMYRNGYMAGEEARGVVAQAQEQVAQAEAEREFMLADPLGFMRQAGMTQNPELLEHIILGLVSEHWDTVRDKVIALDDPMELRTVRAETGRRELEIAGEIQQQLAEQRAVRTNLGEITSAITAITPANLKPSQQRIFERACLDTLKQYADQYDLLTIPVAQLPELLADTLDAWDIDPETAAATIGHAAGRHPGRRPAPVARPAASRPASPAAPRSPAPKPAAAPPRAAPNGQRFVASARRKAAAASPPPGAGSPGTGAVAPPKTKDGKPMGIADTIAWHKANRGRLAPLTNT